MDPTPALTFVLLPGMDGTGRLFEPFQKALGDEERTSVAAYPPDELLGYRDLLPHARRALPGQGAYVLIAESFSGPLAIELAAENPAELCALVLCASFAANPLPTGARLVRGIAPLLFRFQPPSLLVRLLLLGRDAPPELVRATRHAIGLVQPAVLAHRLRELVAVDVRALLREVRVPLFYLAGSGDRLVGRRGLASIRSQRPSVSSAVLEGPHLLLQRQPRAALEHIRRFLTDVGT